MSKYALYWIFKVIHCLVHPKRVKFHPPWFTLCMYEGFRNVEIPLLSYIFRCNMKSNIFREILQEPKNSNFYCLLNSLNDMMKKLFLPLSALKSIFDETTMSKKRYPSDDFQLLDKDKIECISIIITYISIFNQFSGDWSRRIMFTLVRFTHNSLGIYPSKKITKIKGDKCIVRHNGCKYEAELISSNGKIIIALKLNTYVVLCSRRNFL